MDKKSFVFYPQEFLCAVHHFKKAQVADLIISLCEYNLYGELSFKLSDTVKKRFATLQDTVERNNAKYLEICEKRQASGSKGGSKSKAKAKQTVSKTLAKPIEDSPTENEKENESDTEMDNDCRERDVPSVDNSGFVGAPSAENVADYCKELGIAVDVPVFMAWHNERGWRHGKKYVALDWQKAVRQWYCKDAGVPITDFETELATHQNGLDKVKAVQND